MTQKSANCFEPNSSALDLQRFRRVHAVGIAGAGLSAIAKVLLEKGHAVSGSDLQTNDLTDDLAKRGVRIWKGHASEHVQGADLVLVSSAISSDNPEWQEALQRGIPVVKRGPLLAALLAQGQGIAAAGSHGKTTTAGMIAYGLSEAGLRPTFIVGGVMENFGTNAQAGQGPHVVLEADEYDRTFLWFHPDVAVITNIEMDHPDCYTDERALEAAFAQFAAQTKPGGLIVGYGDDQRVADVVRQAAASSDAEASTYGFGEACTWRAVDLSPTADGTTFLAKREDGAEMLVKIALPGEHNVLNALAAIAVLEHLGVEDARIPEALASFKGVQRRFEVRGKAGGVVVIDDYAHHPTQIITTLRAARQKYGEPQIWAVFQPHTYSRLKALWAGFAECFGGADHVIVLPVYAAREAHDPAVRPERLVADMDHPDVKYAAGIQEAAEMLLSGVKPGDVVITLGAGDEWKIGDQLLRGLRGVLARGLHVEE